MKATGVILVWYGAIWRSVPDLDATGDIAAGAGVAIFIGPVFVAACLVLLLGTLAGAFSRDRGPAVQRRRRRPRVGRYVSGG